MAMINPTHLSAGRGRKGGRRGNDLGGSIEQQQATFARGLHERLAKRDFAGPKNRAIDPHREIQSLFFPPP